MAFRHSLNGMLKFDLLCKSIGDPTIFGICVILDRGFMQLSAFDNIFKMFLGVSGNGGHLG
jgi:hypothetical protein